MVMDDRDKQVWKLLGCGLLLMVLTWALLAIIGSVVFMRWSAPPPALRKYHKAADAGDADAMTNIGAMYANGQMVLRLRSGNPTLAFRDQNEMEDPDVQQ